MSHAVMSPAGARALLSTRSGAIAARAGACLLAAVAALALGACQRDPAPVAEAGSDAAPAAVDAPAVTRAPFDAIFSVVDNSGAIRIDGTVGDDAVRAQIDKAVDAAFGPGRATGDLLVEDAARPPEWIGGLPAFLQAFATGPGGAVRFEGNRIVLSGMVELERRRALRAAAERAFPGARLEGLFTLPAEGAAAAAKTLTPQALETTLNQMPVTFEPGGGNVSSDSLDLVTQAADAIRAAPAGTRMLIVGPVVATADAGNDIFLSRQRAEALKVQLILNGISPASIEARGWGQNSDGTPIEGVVPPPRGEPMKFQLLR